MVQWGFPFSSIEGDRVYSEVDFAYFYQNLFKNGVIATVGNNLKVEAASNKGMQVNVLSGSAIVNGRQYMNTDPVALQVPVASSSQDRTDSVAIRLDLFNRIIGLVYKQGDITVVREEMTFELQLARVTVKRNASGVTAADILDMRANEEFCGYSSPYEKVSVSGLEQQYQSLLEQSFDSFVEAAQENQDSLEQLLTDQEQTVIAWFNQIQADTADMLANQQTTIQDWFTNLQNQLDENQAVNLQNQINGLTANHEIFNITHNLKSYPQVLVTCWTDGLGVTGVGETTWLGSVPETLPVTVGYPSWNEISVQVPINWKMEHPVVTETEPFNWLLVEGRKSLRIRILEGGV